MQEILKLLGVGENSLVFSGGVPIFSLLNTPVYAKNNYIVLGVSHIKNKK